MYIFICIEYSMYCVYMYCVYYYYYCIVINCIEFFRINIVFELWFTFLLRMGGGNGYGGGKWLWGGNGYGGEMTKGKIFMGGKWQKWYGGEMVMGGGGNDQTPLATHVAELWLGN